MTSTAKEASQVTTRATTTLAGVTAALRGDGRFSNMQVAMPHPLTVLVRDGKRVVLLAPSLAWDNGRDIFRPFAAHFGEARAALVLLGTPSHRQLDDALNRGLCATVSAEPDVDELYVAVRSAFELIEARKRSEARGQWVNRYRYEIGEFFEIAQAITTERDIDKLLALILEKSALHHRGRRGEHLRRGRGTTPTSSGAPSTSSSPKTTPSAFDFSEVARCPSTSGAMAPAFVALHRRVAEQPRRRLSTCPPTRPSASIRSFDEKIGYRTKSVLTTPLLIARGRRDRGAAAHQQEERSQSPSSSMSRVSSSGRDPLRQAQRRFADHPRVARRDRARERDPLRRAAAHARGLRAGERGGDRAARPDHERSQHPGGDGDRRPRGSGGARRARVSTRTCPGAPTICASSSMPRLLHDFGKIGVREQVLVKAKKLYPADLASSSKRRFALAVRSARGRRCSTARSSSSRPARASDLARRSTTSSRSAASSWSECARHDPPSQRAQGAQGRRLRDHRVDRARDLRRREQRGAPAALLTRASRWSA